MGGLADGSVVMWRWNKHQWVCVCVCECVCVCLCVCVNICACRWICAGMYVCASLCTLNFFPETFNFSPRKCPFTFVGPISSAVVVLSLLPLLWFRC